MIITVGTRKGGSGKSTIATNLATMRKNNGHDVSIVDTDDQQSAAMWCAIRAEAQAKAIAGGADPEATPYVPVMCATGSGVLAAIGAHAKKYNDLVIDSPGKDAPELRASELASETVVIPLRASQFDLWAMEKDLDMLAEIKSMKDAIKAPFRVVMVFNGINTSPNVRDKQLQSMAEYLGALEEKLWVCKAEICPTYLSNRGIYDRAVSVGASVHEIATNTPSDIKAMHEMEGLYRFIYGNLK